MVLRHEMHCTAGFAASAPVGRLDSEGLDTGLGLAYHGLAGQSLVQGSQGAPNNIEP